MKLRELIDAIIEDVDFYCDVFNKEALFVEFIKASGINCFAKLESLDFEAMVTMRSEEITDGKQIAHVESVRKYIRSFFNYHGYPHSTDVYIRTAGDLEEGIEYDLKNDHQQSVIVDDTGWCVTSQKAHKFISPSLASAQIKPKKTNQNLLDLLRPYVNLKGDAFLLFVIWLVQAFCSGNHSALLVIAERGSGKSTLSRVIRRILEPSDVEVSRFPKNEEALLTTLSNLYLVCFDNVRDITENQSDILCSAITGSTATKRSLYTNNDLYVQKLHNTVVLNGISVIPKESDLAERFLVIELKKLTGQELQREKDFWSNFSETLPYILGAIFNTLSEAMKYFKKMSLSNLPRMADAFADMMAIALALGISEEEFRKIYTDNIAKMNKLRSETPLVEAVRELMNDFSGRRSIEGKAERIYSMVKNNYSGDKNGLPGNASHFTRKLEEEHDVLYAAGFRVNIDDTSSDGTEIKIIRRKK